MRVLSCTSMTLVALACATRAPGPADVDQGNALVVDGGGHGVPDNANNANDANVVPDVADQPNAITPAQPNAVQQPNVASQPNANVNANAVTNPNLRYVGRFDTSDANGPIMSWPGSKVVAGFTGTSLAVKLRPVDQQTYYGIGNVDNWISVAIDGNAPTAKLVPQGTTSLTLATNLAQGNHTVELVKRTEAQIGSLQFSGFTLDAGASLVPGPTPRARRLEFIGDSGTVGYGADGNWAATHCGFTPATENALVSYAMVTGDLLGADVHISAGSGKGIYQNRDTVNDKVNTLPVLWGWTNGDRLAQPADANAAAWKPSSWQADAVVVIVSGNDFAASTPSASAYNDVATAFLGKLRAGYPNAWIFVAISPMLDAPVEGETSPSESELGEQYAKAMVSSMNDAKIVYMPLALDDGTHGVGCDYHLNAAGHRVTANAMAAAIKARLGWS